MYFAAFGTRPASDPRTLFCAGAIVAETYQIFDSRSCYIVDYRDGDSPASKISHGVRQVSMLGDEEALRVWAFATKQDPDVVLALYHEALDSKEAT